LQLTPTHILWSYDQCGTCTFDNCLFLC